MKRPTEGEERGDGIDRSRQWRRESRHRESSGMYARVGKNGKENQHDIGTATLTKQKGRKNVKLKGLVIQN